jgi:DNA replication protein DnaC
LLGPEPTWLTCKCGALTARVPCWDCALAAERRADRARAIADAERTIPREYAWSTLESRELRTRVDARRRPLDEIVRCILGAHRVVLAGGAGSGKTSLAVACLRERLPDARFVSAIRLGTARIQHRAGDGEPELIDQALAAPLLLIDDVGQEQHTATSAVKDVIWLRHEAALPTWITTGLRSADLLDRFGDGFRRRMLEHAYVERLGPGP